LSVAFVCLNLRLCMAVSTQRQLNITVQAHENCVTETGLKQHIANDELQMLPLGEV